MLVDFKSKFRSREDSFFYRKAFALPLSHPHTQQKIETLSLNNIEGFSEVLWGLLSVELGVRVRASLLMSDLKRYGVCFSLGYCISCL